MMSSTKTITYRLVYRPSLLRKIYTTVLGWTATAAAAAPLLPHICWLLNHHHNSSTNMTDLGHTSANISANNNRLIVVLRLLC